MLTDAELLAWLLKGAAYLAILPTFLVAIVWTRLAGSALVEHARVQHPQEWRDADGPFATPLCWWPRRGKSPMRIVPWDLAAANRFGFWAWTWTCSLPHRARDCDAFRRLQRRSRAAYFLPLAALVVLWTTIALLP